ncbi:hypothetical protein DY000_02025799 [Brassica cretica]|uniref:RNase H type-1 domain-containing protein n=1 Tax=Brassica cretica TaxID=69181 RepID=A0ABQ7EK37_BRACR|nr:hypothetical protein DY000_02025799 [Brassica cretica]
MVGTESIEHVLFKCGTAHEAWDIAGFPPILQLANRSLVSLIIQLQQAGEEARVWHELNVVQQNMEVRNGLCDENKRWEPALAGYAKCNIHANWRNAKLHSGTALFIRDYSGNVLHHARDALTFSPNRLTTELRCLEWALRSMKDLAYQEIVVEPDFHEPIETMMQSSEWPRFRVLLQRINALCASFASISFATESVASNKIARKIVKSVFRMVGSNHIWHQENQLSSIIRFIERRLLFPHKSSLE